MRNLPKLKVLALCMVLMGALGIAHAVDVNGRIKGTVTDPQGAVLAGIKVTATNEATGVKFDTVTDADGGYLFAQVPVGTYTAHGERERVQGIHGKGNRAEHRPGVCRARSSLQVGSTAEVVEVSASPASR